ncbi:MAG: hypothetical protein DI629_11445 [Mesorhizobium amorphae]|nr:MAG: hypothetical protein DI629_11445 [Mesorhizobium amorphae]
MRFRKVAALGLAAWMGTTAAFAQEAAAPAPTPDAKLTLELNALQPSDRGGCRLTFLVNNGLGSDLEKASFEMALFNEAGVVDRLAVLDFNDLPAGKTKVTRFDLANADCAKISRVLINSATECRGASVAPQACLRQLSASSRSANVTFGL